MKIHLNFSQHLIDKFTVSLIISRVKIFCGIMNLADFRDKHSIEFVLQDKIFKVKIFVVIQNLQNQQKFSLSTIQYNKSMF